MFACAQAKRHAAAPNGRRAHRLPAARLAGAAAGGAAAAAAARAQAFERGNDYARAVEAYLAPTGAGGAPAELDALQRCWEAALALAARHQVGRAARWALPFAAAAGRRRPPMRLSRMSLIFAAMPAKAAVEPACRRSCDPSPSSSQRHRVGAVASAVAARLAAVGRAAAAVDVLEGVGDLQGEARTLLRLLPRAHSG